MEDLEAEEESFLANLDQHVEHVNPVHLAYLDHFDHLAKHIQHELGCTAHPIQMRGNQEEPRAEDELESSLLSDAQLSKSTKDRDNQDATVNDPSVPDCWCYLEQMKDKQKEMVRGEL